MNIRLFSPLSEQEMRFDVWTGQASEEEEEEGENERKLRFILRSLGSFDVCARRIVRREGEMSEKKDA